LRSAEEKTMKSVSNTSTWALVMGGLIAMTSWSYHASAGEIQRILDNSKAFAALPRVKHTPAFRLEPFEPVQVRPEAKGKQWWYIRDGDERVGLITTWLNHVELFRFSPEVAKGAKYEIPPIYHWANLIGARLPLQMCGYHSPVPPVESLKLTFTKKEGGSLEFKAEQAHKRGYSGSTEFRLVWDERLGYVLYCNSHFAMPQPRQIEFSNLLAGGVSESRDGRKRWQKTVRGRLADGGAYLQVDDCRWNWDDVKATRRTERLTGDHEWTRLEIEFTPSPNDPFLLIKLCVEGTGTAWFDDLELAKVHSESTDG
jgi:hypothetical protein